MRTCGTLWALAPFSLIIALTKETCGDDAASVDGAGGIAWFEGMDDNEIRDITVNDLENASKRHPKRPDSLHRAESSCIHHVNATLLNTLHLASYELAKSMSHGLNAAMSNFWTWKDTDSMLRKIHRNFTAEKVMKNRCGRQKHMKLFHFSPQTRLRESCGRVSSEIQSHFCQYHRCIFQELGMLDDPTETSLSDWVDRNLKESNGIKRGALSRVSRCVKEARKCNDNCSASSELMFCLSRDIQWRPFRFLP